MTTVPVKSTLWGNQIATVLKNMLLYMEYLRCMMDTHQQYLELHCSGPAIWGIFGKPWNSAKWWILIDFRWKFKCLEKWPKWWIWPISGDFGNMLKSTHRKCKKRVRKIPKSNKKASSEPILLIIWPKMGAAPGRFQKRAAAFGRRPLLVPFWVK